MYYTLDTGVFSKYFLPRYDIKAPSLFKVRQVGKTLVNRYHTHCFCIYCVPYDNFSRTWLYLAKRLNFSGPRAPGLPPMG